MLLSDSAITIFDNNSYSILQLDHFTIITFIRSIKTIEIKSIANILEQHSLRFQLSSNIDELSLTGHILSTGLDLYQPKQLYLNALMFVFVRFDYLNLDGT